MMGRTWVSRRAALAGLAGLAAGAVEARAQGAAKAAPAANAAAFQPIEISAKRIESFLKVSSEKRFGRLEFRGGLVLSSDDKNFGGWSGLAMEPDGKSFVAVSDEGHWLMADMTYAGTAPSGMTNARIGNLVASNGRDLTRKRDQDAEAVALVEGNLQRGQILIAFERNHRIGRFPVVDRVVQAPAGFLRMPADAKQMKSNKGLEAMTVLAGGPNKGAVVAFSERLTDTAGNHTGWIWVAGEPRRFQIKDNNEFDLTDAVGLPDGSLLLLERRFRWTEGVKMQLRLLRPNEIAPGVLAEGTMLLAADLTAEIDNMEGLAVHRDSRGATVLTLISDDNFNSFLQRTVLLQFTLT